MAKGKIFLAIFLATATFVSTEHLAAAEEGRAGSAERYSEPRGLYSDFARSLSKTSYGYRVVNAPFPVRAGKVAERFELHRGDCFKVLSWDDCLADRERTELKQMMPYIKRDKDYWFSWSIFFPKDYTNIFPVKVALGQFHQEGAGSPPVMFQNGAGGYWIDMNQLGHAHKLLIPESELKERWHDILVNARWSERKSGFVKVWVNGNLKFEYEGQTLTRKGEVFFKYGIYRSFLSRAPKGKKIPNQVVYFDEVKWGEAREQVEISTAQSP